MAKKKEFLLRELAAKELGVPIETLDKTNRTLFRGWLAVRNNPSKPEPEPDA